LLLRERLGSSGWKWVPSHQGGEHQADTGRPVLSARPGAVAPAEVPRYVCVRYISPVVLPGLAQTIPSIRTRPEPLPVTVRLSRRGFDPANP
jgi:hypothetical protein